MQSRAFANFELNRYDDALADYTIAIARAPTLTYCYPGRGNLFLTIREYQKAVDDFTEAISQQPPDALTLSRRAQAYEALGQRDHALDDFRAALVADPKLESAKEGVARLTEEQKRSDSENK